MYFSRVSPVLTFFIAFLPIQLVRGNANFQYNAVTAVKVLQNWYNQSTGLYQSTGWWNSANCITVLADLTAIDGQVDIVTGQIWPNTFEKAQKFNLRQSRSPNSCATTVCTDAQKRDLNYTKHYFDNPRYQRKREVQTVGNLQIEDADPKGFLNGFYDDEGWWALAWIKVYDLTKTPQYLKAADDIFSDMVSTGYNATCGGIWWDKKKQANTAIANELFLSVAAHLANRMPNKAYYANWATRQWDWFQRSGMINADGVINDGLNLKTCRNDNGDVWSYNQGVILGGLVELSKATNNGQLLLDAQDIANAAIRTMVDKDGILHDPREPNLGGDGYQFKGVFVRNLHQLQKATGSALYKNFLERNGQAVWDRARNQKDNVFTGVWSGPFDPAHANAATQSSGLDALAGLMAVSKEAPPPPPALVVQPASLPIPSQSPLPPSPLPPPAVSPPVAIVANNTRIVNQAPIFDTTITIDFDLDLLADSLEDDDLEDTYSSVLFYWLLSAQKMLDVSDSVD